MQQTSTRVRETRLAQARASLHVVAGLVVAMTLAATIAVVWLFVRTGFGRTDAAASDALLGAALVLAVPPAWFAWIVMGTAPSGVETAALADRARRWGRLMGRPVALPIWGWLGLVGAAAGSPLAALVCAIAGLIVAIRGLVSLVRWVIGPTEPALRRVGARPGSTSELPPS